MVALFSNRGLRGVGQRLRELIDTTESVPQEEVLPASVEPYRLEARLGADAVEEVVKRYLAGEPSTALSKEIGVSKSALLDLLQRHGVVRRRRSMSQDVLAEATARYREGAALSQLASEFGFSQECIRRKLIATGVILRPPTGGKAA